MCIYDLPVFEDLLCDRPVADGHFQFFNITKHILTCSKLFLQFISVTARHNFLGRMSDEDFHW